MTGVHQRYATLQAARRGDRKAFDIIWQDFREPLCAIVRRTLPEAHNLAKERQVLEVMGDVHDRSFEELQHKPSNWSTYGWLSWIAHRESMRRAEQAV
ncbi:MAG: hypothetical protein WEF86_08105 [Gemmatimonadota bacterium]